MGSALPSLFDSIEGDEVHDIQERMELDNSEWLALVRAGFAFHHVGRRVTTDDLWAYLDAHGIDLPPDASPNLLGSFFSGWDRAQSTDSFIRSERKGAHGNLLRLWVVV